VRHGPQSRLVWLHAGMGRSEARGPKTVKERSPQRTL